MPLTRYNALFTIQKRASHQIFRQLSSSQHPLWRHTTTLQQQRSVTSYVDHQKPSSTEQLPAEQQRLLKTLPVSYLLRSLVVLSATNLPAPLLLRLISVIKKRAHLIESSRVLQWIVNQSFYKHFCIGAQKDEIISNSSSLRQMGINGIILTYAREAPPAAGSLQTTSLTEDEPNLSNWVTSNHKTIDMTMPGDYIALRITGGGPVVCDFLERYTKAKISPTATVPAALAQEHKALESALRSICKHAQKNNTRILIDAEGSRYQAAIDDLSLNLMPEFNKTTSRGDRAMILNTYQLYLKSNIDKIKRHVQHSIDNQYLLGLKLVRGAYMYVDGERSFVHDTKQDTDDSYDAAVRYLLEGGDNGKAGGTWPVDVMLATHNSESVRKALDTYKQVDGGKTQHPRIRGLQFAQLMGMADELSMQLADELEQSDKSPVQTSKTNSQATQHKQRSGEAEATGTVQEDGNYTKPRLAVYKYTVWGTISDCLLYMLRRAEENTDALARSRVTSKAMFKELWLRMTTFG